MMHAPEESNAFSISTIQPFWTLKRRCNSTARIVPTPKQFAVD